jgi:pSer/pThr/pTyr-binding forkhead associated (FHA) protein
MYRIRVQHRSEIVAEFRVNSHRVTIGSADGCDVQLDAARKVAAKHALIEGNDAGGWTISPVEGAHIVCRGEVIGNGHALKSGHSFLIGEFVVMWLEDTLPDVDADELMETTLPSVEVPRLRLMSGPQSGHIINLDGDLKNTPATIGRAAGNVVMLDDRSISRKHARIEEDDRGYMLVDNGSSYGIRVEGGSEVQQLRLLNGTTFCLGDVQFLFECPVRPLSHEDYEEMARQGAMQGVDEDTAPHANREAVEAFDAARAIETKGGLSPFAITVGLLLVIVIFLGAALLMLLMQQPPPDMP